jgi:hypothetical protein
MSLVIYSARLKSALSKITQDSDQWIKPQNVSYSPSSPLSMNSTFTQMDVMPTAPPSSVFTSYGLKVCWFIWWCLYAALGSPNPFADLIVSMWNWSCKMHHKSNLCPIRDCSNDFFFVFLLDLPRKDSDPLIPSVLGSTIWRSTMHSTADMFFLFLTIYGRLINYYFVIFRTLIVPK